jgi:hypothetical protein
MNIKNINNFLKDILCFHLIYLRLSTTFLFFFFFFFLTSPYQKCEDIGSSRTATNTAAPHIKECRHQRQAALCNSSE